MTQAIDRSRQGWTGYKCPDCNGDGCRRCGGTGDEHGYLDPQKWLVDAIEREAKKKCMRCEYHHPLFVSDDGQISHGTDWISTDVYAPPEPCEAEQLWKILHQFNERFGDK